MSCCKRTDVRDEIAKRLRSLARIGEYREETQRRLARELGWKPSRVFEAWHRRARITVEEAEQLRAIERRTHADQPESIDERIARLEKEIKEIRQAFPRR
jgi:hypothetical protein